MELDLDIFTLLKMGAKLASHKAQQYFYCTSETHVRPTNEGEVKGVKRKAIYGEHFYAFEGIPYAKPPIGELRFRAPQPMEPWKDIRDCTQSKSKPMQIHIMLNFVEGSEDCLYLNVYAKKLESTHKLPVIVWIHGGGYQVGEASRDIYAPDYLMQQDIILVTIGYRLNALGFLSFNDPDLGIPGNAGIKDQIMALKWIKSNIGNFNGDPNNITVMGESAGAASTHILMSTPHTKGLFHKAIMMSGSAYCPWAVVPQRDWAYRLACALGYKGANNDKEVFRFLKALDSRKIVGSTAHLLTKEERLNGFIISFGPTIEAYDSEMAVIRKPILEMVREAWSNDIPLLIGGTSFEGLFSYGLAKGYPYIINEIGNGECLIPLDAVDGKSQAELLQTCKKLVENYIGYEEPQAEKHFYPYLHIMSSFLIWNAVFRTILARQNYAKHTPTYLYRFDCDSTFQNHFRILRCGPKQRGVSHADDLSYIFYNAIASKLDTNTMEYKTIQRMCGILTAFAKLSNPNCTEIETVKWEPIDEVNDAMKCLNISNEVNLQAFPELKTLQMWTEFYTKENLC